MNYGVAIFAYNRPEHLQQVLQGLKKNISVNDIYIFQDGLKKEEHRTDWENTTKVIKNIEWCRVHYKLAANNKGLAKSLIDGINCVFEEKEAVIVLEDDCVPAANFINFMDQCFDKYQDNKNVYCISGYSWPIDVSSDEYDIYFTGRISSWGWGTWKDRWQKYNNVDDTVAKRLMSKEQTSRYMAKWGSDLEEMLNQKIQGKNNSWAVYWALNVIENYGICVAPYCSLINNVGFDGTGVHCGVTGRFNVAIDKNVKDIFRLPSVPHISKETEVAFADLYGSYTAVNDEDTKEKILVYGVGYFFKKHEKEINNKYYISAFVDGYKVGYYAGKPIIKIDEISQHVFSKILIMINDLQVCLEIADRIKRERCVLPENIIYGLSEFGDILNGGDAFTETSYSKQ